MAAFRAYKDVSQHSILECGAYVVNASLLQLGISPGETSVSLLEYDNISEGYTDGLFAVKINLKEVASSPENQRQGEAQLAARDSYSVTGNLIMNCPEKRAKYANGFYSNSPSGLIQVAYQLNGEKKDKVELFYTNSAKAEFEGYKPVVNEGSDNKNLFDVEIKLVEKINHEIKRTKKDHYTSPSNGGVDALMVRYEDTGAMHWIAVVQSVDDQNKCSVYDPATGNVSEIAKNNLDNKSELKVGDTEYKMGGIWIRLTN
ncbi:hypothetical protein [Pseudovibrio axinellae]|nr:hypothetical protein [Pseudovibrio axinellae]